MICFPDPETMVFLGLGSFHFHYSENTCEIHAIVLEIPGKLGMERQFLMHRPRAGVKIFFVGHIQILFSSSAQFPLKSRGNLDFPSLSFPRRVKNCHWRIPLHTLSYIYEANKTILEHSKGGFYNLQTNVIGIRTAGRKNCAAAVAASGPAGGKADLFQ